MAELFDELSEKKLIGLLNQGAVGVLPTDTVYGLVCKIGFPESIKRINSLKQRETKPGTIIAASTRQLINMGLEPGYVEMVAHFWPGPVSIEMPCPPKTSLRLLMTKDGSIAVRIPDNKSLTELLTATGPLATSSANITGLPTITTCKAAQELFGDKIDFYVDGGDLSDRLPSTVIRVVEGVVKVLRPGAYIVPDK